MVTQLIQGRKAYWVVSREDFEALLDLLPPTDQKKPGWFNSSEWRVTWVLPGSPNFTLGGGAQAVELNARGLCRWFGARCGFMYGTQLEAVTHVRIPAYIGEAFSMFGKGARGWYGDEQSEQWKLAHQIFELLGLNPEGYETGEDMVVLS